MYQLRPPDARLAPYIEHYWFVQATTSQPFDLTVDVYVDLRADLVFNFGVPYTRTVPGREPVTVTASNLDAQRLTSIKIAQKGFVIITGVRFLVGGLAPFISRSVHEWNDKVIPVEQAFDGDIAPTQRGADVDTQKRLLDDYFVGRMSVTAAKETFFALKARIESGASLMNELGVPMRQLDRLFKTHLGFAPKTFARVVRFQKALTRLKADPGCTLAAIAAECGYYDQSHFIREHKVFAGVAPRQQVGYFPPGAPSDFSPNVVQFVQYARPK